MDVNVDNLIKQMEEVAHSLETDLPSLSDMIEEWAKAVEELRSHKLSDSVQKAVAAAKCHQLYDR